MKPLVIKIHSFVDVITNSSTEIYVMAHKQTLQTAKDLINYFLELGGSKKKADDLFEFKLYIDEYYNRDDEEYHKVDLSDEKKLDTFLDDFDWDNMYDITLEIIPKDKSKEAIDLAGKLRNIFSIEVSCEG